MKKLKKVDKIIILGGVFLAIFILGFWASLKRTDRNYYIPENFEGWVSIKYNYPGAEESKIGDKGWEIHIPDSGYLITSTPLEKGWGTDRFFWKGPGKTTPIPNYLEQDGKVLMYIHARDIRRFSHQSMLRNLAPGTDTTLWDGTKIERKQNNEISYQPGKVTLEYFYVFRKPQPLNVKLPLNPNREALESMKDYELNSSN